LALARARAGNSIPARIAMMAITTSNSMSVKADGLVSRDANVQKLCAKALGFFTTRD
jgi:hypothetical protein